MDCWRLITDDDTVINSVTGYSIPFTSLPYQICLPKSFQPNSEHDTQEMENAIKKLQTMGAVSICKPSTEQFISSIFLIPKSSGGKRFILNLKLLNKFVLNEHFKMEDHRTAMTLINHNEFLAKIDLKEAYLLVPIDPNHRKYLRFQYKNNLYEFNALPYGLSSAPYIFTKIMRVVVAHLREKGHKSVIYLDDLLCVGSDYKTCQKNVHESISLLESLGFVINFEKCYLEPTQSCNFLGFVFNTTKMTLELPLEKKKHIFKLVNKYRGLDKCAIRELAQLIGLLISACPAVQYGWVYTKYLERHKYLMLSKNDNNFDSLMALNSDIKDDLDWWSKNIFLVSKHFQCRNFNLEIYTDASRTGWGAVCNENKVNGAWKQDELIFHINYLELLAIFLALKSFVRDKNRIYILLRVDNKTAISYINRMGGIQYPHLNNLARTIWQWCEERDIWLFASYIKSSENKEADEESRKINPDTEWELNERYFQQISIRLGTPHIDLFASRVNAKCSRYISWKPDPDAVNIDAFTVNWNNQFFYAFPPFSLILKCLQKIKHERATGIMIMPYWPSQPWFPMMKEMLTSQLMFFGPKKDLLYSPFRSNHPLYRQLTLVAGVLSGDR